MYMLVVKVAESDPVQVLALRFMDELSEVRRMVRLATKQAKNRYPNICAEEEMEYDVYEVTTTFHGWPKFYSSAEHLL